MIPIWLKGVLKALALPPTGLLLLALVGLGLIGRRPRLGRAIALGGVFGLLALSMPVVSSLLVTTLHPPHPFVAADANGAGAVVILGGGARRPAPDYGGDTLSSLTLERVRYGARVARITGLPVLVSGGGPYGMVAEAVLMQRTLEQEFDVPVRWTERRSGNTHENAVFSARILKAAGVNKVVLVMHAFDMKRASAEFNAAGIECVPAATHIPPTGDITIFDWIPSLSGLQTSYYASYEILANTLSIFQVGR